MCAWNPRITGAGFENLRTLPKLIRLYAMGSNVNDRGLAHLSQTRLTFLSLWATKVTDSGLKHLSVQMRLSHNIGYTKLAGITDQGLKHLKEISNLENLGLAFTDITDVGLAHLNGNLKTMGIDVSQAKYLKVIPQCARYPAFNKRTQRTPISKNCIT